LSLALRFDAAANLPRATLIAPDSLEDLDQTQVDLAPFHIDTDNLYVYSIP